MKRSQFSTLTTAALTASVACGLLLPATAVAAPEVTEDGFLVNGVTAHRGFPEAFPENTFQGYEASIELGVDWIELDVFTTADNQLVVSHDKTTGRFADRDLTIAESTYDELAELDVAHSFREEHGLTEEEVPPARMPLLSEIIDMIMAQDKTRASLQPKDQSTEAAVEMIQTMGAQKWTGFNDGNLEKMSLVKELDPSIHVFWDLPASGDLDEEIAIATDRGFESLIANQQRISPEIIERIEAAGFESGAWTVNESAVMQQFIDWGIDRLYTDSADQAMLLFGSDHRAGLEHQLVGHWSMDDEGSNTADETGTPNPLRNGRLQSGAAQIGAGHLNGSVQLNGTEDFVDVPFEVIPDTAAHYTASAWFKPENPGDGRQTILETSGSRAISVELADTSGNLSYAVEATEQSVSAETDAAPSEGQWHHVAVTYDAASGETGIHLDGKEINSFVDGSQQVSGTLAHTDGLHIGTSQAADGQFFEGQIDEVAVWNRVLEPDELTTLWNDGAGHALPKSYTEPTDTPQWWEPIPNDSEPEPEPAEGDIQVEAEVEGIGQGGDDGENPDPGSLVLSVSDGSAALGDQRNAGDRLRMTGVMPAVAVTDTRQEGNGWSVAGQSSDLTDGEESVTADHLGWIPNVVDQDDNAIPGTAVRGTLAGGEGLSAPQILGEAHADNRLGSTELSADLNLEVPVDTAAGTYEGAVSVSLFPVD